PRPVQVSGLHAADKVYDGGTTATLTGQAVAGTVAGDNVAVGGSPVASFADRNVGPGKAVTVTGFALTGADAANYTLQQPTGLLAGITPAQLLYVATPTTRTTGQSLDGLTGSIAGFLGGDTLGSATTGTAIFLTTAAAGAGPGTYAVLGGGLSAT